MKILMKEENLVRRGVQYKMLFACLIVLQYSLFQTNVGLSHSFKVKGKTGGISYRCKADPCYPDGYYKIFIL